MNFLNNLAKKNHLVLKKNQNVNILLGLMFNLILRIKLSFFKWFKKIKHPIIHYYAICWNEEKMLPFVFDYYDHIVDKFVIYDNYSTDNTLELISKNKKANFIQYSSDGKINDEIYLDIKNNVWKQSRGKADYVIVCDMDEFLYHTDIKHFILDVHSTGYTFFKPKGFEMYSEIFPTYNQGIKLPEIIKTGYFSDKYSKPMLFDPHRIVEINYLPGAHQAFPLGIVKRYEYDNLKLLHYKNLGKEYLLNRISQYRNRLSDVNKQKGYGAEYELEDKKLVEDFNNGFRKSTKVI